MIAMSLLALVADEITEEGSFWLPPKHSSLAGHHDGLFYFILWLSVFFFVLIVGLMVLFLVRYRRREGHREQPSPAHNTVLEVTWSLIPTALLVVIFVWGFRSYLYGREAPADAETIRVVGKKWSWEFIYANGVKSSELHVPVGEPVKLIMTSVDVIHSMYLPTLRLKRDVVPGRSSELWFDANVPGVFPLRCAEYCGQQHSDMVTKFVVHPKEEGTFVISDGVQKVSDAGILEDLSGKDETLGSFESWLDANASPVGTMPLAEAGAILIQRNACLGCHSLDGTKMIGPSFKGIWGREEEMEDGGRVTVDENYVRESITQPQKRIVKGYTPSMPPYQGTFSEEELGAIIEYLKGLK